MTELLGRVGARLRQLRREEGLTQEQLAEAAGLSYKFIGEIERGVGNPTITTLAALAKALKVDVIELLTEPHAFNARVSARDATLAREALESIEAFIQRAAPPRGAAKYTKKRR